MSEKTPTYEKVLASALLASSAVMGGLAINNHLEASQAREAAVSVAEQDSQHAEALRDFADDAEAYRNTWGTRAVVPLGGAALMLAFMGERGKKEGSTEASTAKPTDLPKL